MAITLTKLFSPTQLTGSAATIYTVPANPASTTLQRGRVRFCNFDTAARAVTAYAVPSGGSAGNTNIFLNAESIAPNTHLDCDIPQLAAGDFLSAFADVATKVTISALDGILAS